MPIAGLQAEVCDLRTEAGLHLFVHLVAGFHQLHSQVHVVPREAVVGPQSKSSRQEADQMILQSNTRNGFQERVTEQQLTSQRLIDLTGQSLSVDRVPTA